MKKALSVFLSLLMVITTISVVFTLPASAATAVAFSEDFEGYNSGDTLGAAAGTIPTGNGWVKMSASNLDVIVNPSVENLSVGETAIANFDAVSGSNVAKFNSWTNAGYVMDVIPGVTYTFSVKMYTTAETGAAEKTLNFYDVTGKEGKSIATQWSKSQIKVDGQTVTGALTDGASKPNNAGVAGAWLDAVKTYTVPEGVTKVFFSMMSEVNSSLEGGALKLVYVDDFSITYDAKPTVKTTTYGAATKNGGVAWVDTDVTSATEGMSVTYKAMPYESSLFDGWYVNGNKVSTELTYTQDSWAAADVVEAKFEALSENIWPDVENRTTFNKAGDKWAGNAKFPWYGGGLKTHVTVDQTLLTTGSSYGLSGLIKDDNVYAGKLSYTLPSAGSHFASQIVKVKPNTNYTLTFWYYATTAITVADTYAYDLDKAYHIYYADDGLGFTSKEEARIIYTSGDALKNYTDDEGNVIQKKIAHTATNTSTTGAWTKATVTFTSDAELPYVIISLKSASAYIDHVTLCEAPVATTPTVSVSDNGMNAGFIQSVSDVYYEGDTFTATAVGYDNGTFLGWYVNDQKVSDSLTYVFTYDSEATYVAKFDALTKNIFEDGSFEGYASTPTQLPTSGQGASSPGMFVWGTWNGTVQTPTAKGWVGTQYGRGYVASASAVGQISAGATPYAGNNVAVGYTGSHAIGKVVPVEPNKTYKLVYYTYSLSANAISTAKNHVVGVDMSDGTVANDGMTFLVNGTDGQTKLTTTYTSFDAATTGAWVRQEATFNSGDYTNVLVQFGVGASQGLMIDHISVFEVLTAFAPTITVDDGGKNAGIVYDVTEVYKDGDTFSATAKAYANGTFLGWYVGDVLASTSETATLTYDSTKTYTAKFSAKKVNIWPADSAPSSTTPLYKGNGHTTPKAIGANDWTGQSYATILHVDNDYIATLGDGLKAFAGDSAYYFSSHNGHQAYKVVRGLKTNTQYTIGYWVYSNLLKANGTVMGDPTKSDTEVNLGKGVNYGITGIATGATMIEVDDMYVKVGDFASTYPQVRPEQSVVTKNVVANEWCYVERTFNTGANTDFLVNFGNNDSTLVMYDHIALFETPVQVTPSVTVDDGGNNAGRVYGVTKVWEEGETFTAITMPYENGTFMGFYVGDTKLADDKVVANADGSYTATFTYDKDAVYTAKYSAEQKNIFPDHEDRTIFNKVGDKFVGTAAYHWVSGAPVNHTVIDKDILTAVTTYGYGGSVINADKVYAGDSSFTGSTTGGHTVYQIVKVEPNTKYELTYYYYQDSVIHKTSGIYSINLDIAQNIYTDVYTSESADDLVVHTTNIGYLKDFTSEAGVHQVLLASTNEGSFSETGEWTKMVRTFTSDELGWVAIPFASDVAGTYYVDHVSLVKVPAPMTVTVNDNYGYLVVDGKYAESAEFAVGETANVTLKTYAGSVFQGWYEDPTLTGEPVSTDPALNIAATEGATVYAKFVTSNIISDPGFENIALGSIEDKYEIYGWYTGTTSGYKVLDGNSQWLDMVITDSSAGITPYSGTKMLRVNHRNNDGALRRLTGLKKNTTYTISFMANMENDHAEGDCFLEAVAVTDLDVLAVSRYGGDEKEYTPYSFKPHSRKYQLAETVATHADWGWTTPEWKRVTLTFNSGNLEEANLLITFHSEAGAMLIDEFTIQESISSTVSVETVYPFGKTDSNVVGGRAEITPDVNNSIYAGVAGTAKATLKATAFDNNQFLGWYVGETKVSNDATTVVEFTEATNYVAKFASYGFDKGTPVYVDGVYGAGFENATKSENFVVLSDKYAVPTVVGQVLNSENKLVNINKVKFEEGQVWTSSNKDRYGQIGVTKEMAFEGDYSLVVRDGAKGESVFNKITGLTENTDYSLSFWYYIPEATLLENGTPANYIHYIAVDPVDATTFESGLPQDNENALYFGWHQSLTVHGEWTQITVNFNTGANTEVALNIGYVCSGSVERTDNQPQDITNLYIDNLEVYSRSALNAAASTAFQNSVERGGVAIRVADESIGRTQALRFKARIAKERLTAMTLGADYTVVEYGTIAMNAAYIAGTTEVEKANNLEITLDENGNKVTYTNAGKNAVVGVTYNSKSGANKVFEYKPGQRDLIFTAALTGIGKNMEGQRLADAYRTEYIVRTYAILELADGTKIVVHDDVNDKETFRASVEQVANEALRQHDLGNKVLDTETLNCVGAISALCSSYPEATPENGVVSSYSVTYNGAGLADKTLIENFFVDEKITIDGDKGTHANSQPIYYATSQTIRLYNGNTLSLKAKDGYYVSSVVITTTADELYSATTSSGVATTDGLATTITGINSAEFVLTATNKVFITGITINYNSGVAPDPVYPEPEIPEEPEDPNVTEVNASDLGLENGTKLSETPAELGTVILGGSKGTNTGGSVPTYYSSDNTLRTYAGNTLTFSATTASAYGLRNVTAGKNIKSIVITYKSKNTDEADPNATVNVGTIVTDGAVATITDINAREVVMTFAAKARIISIKVVTEDIAPCETHEYTNDCDVECNVCYAVRYDAPHAFVSDCDTTCECGATREALADHTADACADACELCGEAVVPTHKFAGECDATCDCGETQEPTAEHNYVDGVCDVCGAIEPTSCEHEYDNGCDADCNLCFAVREDLTHTFVSDCDTKCEYCDETRETETEHNYTYVCSTECNACGATREADHDFTNGDCECGEPKPTEVTTTLNIADYAAANGWTDAKQFTTIVDGNITIKAIGGSNTGKYYTNGNNWRIYQGESGKVTLTAAAGYTIVSVKFTYANSNGGVFKYNDATAASGTVVAINNTTATFIAGNTGTATNGQVRITDIEVTYDIIPECADEDHIYASNCSTECSVCGKDRVAPHAYVSDCDTTCECGATREALADHTTDDACKTACDLCGEAVVATHKYAGDCDTTCECGATREALNEHTYTDNCDEDCDVCGFVRDEIPHVWTDGYDAECDNCGEIRIPPLSCEHTYTDDCDADCNNCGVERAEIPHKFAGACDATCDCGATQEVTADHTWADDCDADCDVCGLTRTAPHQYEFPCSDTCVCGATRTPAEHDFTNGDCVCGEPKPTSTTVNVKVQNYASANNWTNGTKYSSIVLDSNITATVTSGTNTGKYYTSGYEWRLYQTESAKLTITANNGKIIKSVKITYNVSNTGVLKLNSSNVTSGTIVTVNASSIQFTVGNSGSASNGQVKVTAIEVVYGDACNHSGDEKLCDTICDACGMTIEATAEHTVDDGCDVDCNVCGTAVTPTHEDDDILCDTICGNCDAEVAATAEHTYDDDKDADCNVCGDVRVPPASCDHANADACDTVCPDCDEELVPTHKWASDCDTTCECGETREALADHSYTYVCSTECSICGETTREAEHDFTNGDCECGEPAPSAEPELAATFNLGANGNATHADGSSKTSYTETNNGYTLSLTNVSNFYTGARDAKGNGAIKLGASSKTGGFSFTVGADVSKVVIYVAGYKAKTVSVQVGSETHKITVTSDNGQYQAIEIDTTTNKTVTLTTTSTGYRAMVNTIEFYA